MNTESGLTARQSCFKAFRPPSLRRCCFCERTSEDCWQSYALALRPSSLPLSLSSCLLYHTCVLSNVSNVLSTVSCVLWLMSCPFRSSSLSHSFSRPIATWVFPRRPKIASYCFPDECGVIGHSIGSFLLLLCT